MILVDSSVWIAYFNRTTKDIPTRQKKRPCGHPTEPFDQIESILIRSFHKA